MSTTERKHILTKSTLSALVMLGLAFIVAPGKTAESAAAFANTEVALPSEDLKITLLEWIGENSSYDVSASIANPPAVRFCDRGKPFIYEGRMTNFDEMMRGAYDGVTKEICLARPWNASSDKDVGVLLHELIHHVQFESRFSQCARQSEWGAYKLQEAWLKDRNIDPEFNWAYIFFSSRCSRRDIHP